MGDEDVGQTTATSAPEYRMWKQNSAFLYDLVISHALEWPSLTVQWLPWSSSSSSAAARSSPYSSSSPNQNLLLGTYTSQGAPNLLMIAAVSFPPSGEALDPSFIPTVEVSQSVRHEGEVNRARYMPTKPSLVATKTCGPEVHLFHLSHRCPEEDEDGDGPDVVLKGHEYQGFGISWSPMKKGYLLSGSFDKRICLWDVNLTPAEGSLDANEMFDAHEAAVQDVSWHSSNENLFGSVGDDRLLMIWDLRLSTSKKPQSSVVAHNDEVNSLSFNPFNEWILATASTDCTVKLFDLRKLPSSLYTFHNHTKEVLQVEWNPKFQTILASSAADKKLVVWDVSRIGDEQSDVDENDPPPELLFTHRGHTATISEFSWSPNEPWTIASVAEDNILQVWQIAEKIRDGIAPQND